MRRCNSPRECSKLPELRQHIHVCLPERRGPGADQRGRARDRQRCAGAPLWAAASKRAQEPLHHPLSTSLQLWHAATRSSLCMLASYVMHVVSES